MEEVAALDHFEMSVNSEALDPEHVSEANDLNKDILENINNTNHNDFIEGITHPSFKNSSKLRTVNSI